MSGILIQFIDLLNPYKVINFISSFPLFELLQNLMFSNAAFQVWKPIVSMVAISKNFVLSMDLLLSC